MDWRTAPTGRSSVGIEDQKNRSPWLLMLAGVAALVVLIGGVKACNVVSSIRAMKAQGEPHATVSSIKAQHQEWRATLEAVGTVRPVRGAELSTELPGVVESFGFQSGQDVAQGDLIAQLRVKADVATLRAAESQYQLARTTFERAKAQNAVNLISKADYDAAQANLNSARAEYEAQKAGVDKRSIRAPFAGRLGIIMANIGQYVDAGQRIVTLQALDPVFVDFSLPQQALSQIATGQAVATTVDAYPDLRFTGTIQAIDPKVDERTRNVSVRAAFQNPERKLLPGMFTRIAVDIGEPQRYLTLPQTAVTYNPYGETVYVIVQRGQENLPDPNAPKEALQPAPPAGEKKPADGDAKPDNTRVARQVFIAVGGRRGDQVAILRGLKEGDEVVTSGQLKLRNGMPVDVDNSVQPSFDADPAPVEQ